MENRGTFWNDLNWYSRALNRERLGVARFTRPGRRFDAINISGNHLDAKFQSDSWSNCELSLVSNVFSLEVCWGKEPWPLRCVALA